MVLRDDRGPDRPKREDRLLEELRRTLGDVGTGGADLPDLELTSARGVPDAHDPSGRLDPVPGVERGEEFDGFVRAEEALIAVVAHRELGDEVAKDRKSTRLNSSHTVISYAVL